MFEIIIDLYNKLLDILIEKIKKVLEKIKKHKKGLTRTLVGIIIIVIIVGIAYVIKNKPNIIRIDHSNQSDNIIVDNSKQRNTDNKDSGNNSSIDEDGNPSSDDKSTSDGNAPSDNNDKGDSSDKDKSDNNPDDNNKDNSKYLNPDNISDEELDKLIKENEEDKKQDSNNNKNDNSSNYSNNAGDPIPEGGLTPPINNGSEQGTPSADGNDFQNDPTVSVNDKQSGVNTKLSNTYYKLLTNKEPISEHIPKDALDKMLDTAFHENKDNTTQIQSSLMNYTEKGEKLFSVADVKTAELGCYPSLTKMYYSILGVKGNYDYIYLKLYYTKETNNYTLYYVNSTVNKDFK